MYEDEMGIKDYEAMVEHELAGKKHKSAIAGLQALVGGGYFKRKNAPTTTTRRTSNNVTPMSPHRARLGLDAAHVWPARVEAPM